MSLRRRIGIGGRSALIESGRCQPTLFDSPEVAQPRRRWPRAEAECTRCPLYKFATQAVPGEGRRHSRHHAGRRAAGRQGGPRRQAVRRTGRAHPRSRRWRRPASRAARSSSPTRSSTSSIEHARQAPAAQAAERLRDRALPVVARARARDRAARSHRRARRDRGAQRARASGDDRQDARPRAAARRRHARRSSRSIRRTCCASR